MVSAPLIGFVGAGEEFFPIEDHAGAGYEEVDIRLDVDDPVAVRVRGRSMMPVYRPGDDLFCARLHADLSEAVGRDCVVMTVEGAGYVKLVRRGACHGRFVLRSYNSAFDDIEDVHLLWAAPILMIKRGA